jgi:malate dehydrogenase (oxaloacetate-decarboxylating)
VVLAALIAAVKLTGSTSGSTLRDQQIVILGAGSASIGVADYIRQEMIIEGLNDEEARSRFWIVKSDGLLHTEHPGLTAEQMVYARAHAELADWPRGANGAIGLAEVVAKIRVNVLIGLSTVGGAFREPIVREMAGKVARPIIFPLSNPTSKSEATAEDLIVWTGGRALVATGSPFPPVVFGDQTIPIAQCNNVCIFPALGLGVVAAKARRVTDGMILAAARSLAEHSPAISGLSGRLLPPVEDLRRVAVEIAIAVGLEAQKAGVAPQTSREELWRHVTDTQWSPAYLGGGL